jgi:hypothetical protein
MTTRRQFTYGLFGATLAARAEQEKPDFSGTWTLDADRTEGPFTPPAMTQVIDHKDPVFKWTTKFKEEGTPKLPVFLTGFAVPSGEVKTDAHYETTKIQAGERETRTMWNGQRLVTTWTIRTLHDPSQGKWQRSLSDDGKTQTVDLEYRSAMMGLVQAKLVFVKLSQ